MHDRPRHAVIGVHTRLDPPTGGNPSLPPALTMPARSRREDLDANVDGGSVDAADFGRRNRTLDLARPLAAPKIV
jgi:hypothetical protein